MGKSLIITFKNTASAMGMERLSKEGELSGKLIAIPEELDAGCGLSRQGEVGEREKIIKAMEENDIAYDGIYEMEI